MLEMGLEKRIESANLNYFAYEKHISNTTKDQEPKISFEGEKEERKKFIDFFRRIWDILYKNHYYFLKIVGKFAVKNVVKISLGRF